MWRRLVGRNRNQTALYMGLRYTARSDKRERGRQKEERQRENMRQQRGEEGIDSERERERERGNQ